MSSTLTCQDCQPSTEALPGVAPSPVPVADPLLDPSTFSPPQLSDGSQSETPRVVIEFCDRCRWLHRATWTQTELFLTFPPPIPAPAPATAAGGTDSASEPATGLKAITLVPRNSPETGGRFRVWLLRDRHVDSTDTKDDLARGWNLVWDRKIEGGFPEMKILKQRIRNLIAPSQSLGHSDKPANAVHGAVNATTLA
ncbi:SelT/SelW/SelH family protein [Sporobolomyces koalae]|uniref:SelT/SelW/SelH family protein n=1 Tax=Sporobolomyces koalae TaxID=500713 RepID=UPI00317FD193